jgi:hypothetical protein
MNFSRPAALAIASLACVFSACMFSACTNSNITNKPDDPTKPQVKNLVHKAVPEVTAATAGAAKCSFQNVQQIGALAKDGGIAIGFGAQGGLAAWSSPDGPRVKPLSVAGVAQGSAAPIQFPKGAQPAAIIAVARGFAVIAKRIETTAEPCAATCGDKPCPVDTKADAKPAEGAAGAAQTCEKPTGHEFFTQLTDLDGTNASAGRPFHTGLVDIETILPGDGRAAGLLTKNEVVWLQKRPDGRLDSERIELPTDEYVIPVFGAGPPSILLVDNGGSLRVLDERGFHEVEGKFVGMVGKPATAPPAKPGTATAAKPPAPAPAPKPAGEMTFRSHWGTNGRIEVARRLGDSMQFAVVEKLVVRMVPDAESQEIRKSFAKALDLRLENGRLRRTGWDKQPVGGDIDAHEADPAADVTQMHIAWTGNAFVFAHRSNPPHRANAPSVGIVAAMCAGDKVDNSKQ